MKRKTNMENNDKKPENVAEIVIDYLKRNGYDGLCNNDCGCDFDKFMPCDCPCSDCEPAHKVLCKEKDCDDCADNGCVSFYDGAYLMHPGKRNEDEN
jgi:hypothetical protein